jgi:hypothetical protein
VSDTREQLTLRDAIASQLIGHDHLRHILQILQQPLEETLGVFAVASALNEDVEYNAADCGSAVFVSARSLLICGILAAYR